MCINNMYNLSFAHLTTSFDLRVCKCFKLITAFKMESEGGSKMTTVFKGLKIICSLVAFICAMIIGFPWQIGIVAFFNIMQLVVLVYAIVAVVMRVALRIQVGNWWKYDCIVTIVLACLEFAATTTWAVAAQVNYSSLTAMVAFGYITGIICIASASHLILSM